MASNNDIDQVLTEVVRVGGQLVLVGDPYQLGAIDAGPGYSTAHGPVVEGDRIQIGLIRMPRGTGKLLTFCVNVPVAPFMRG